MDIVIPYIYTRSDELIYVLRSLKNIPHRNVYIIGDKPRFQLKNITYFYQEQTHNPALNTNTILTKICETEEISDDFIWLADDIYFLKPIKEIPTLHRGLYKDIVEKNKKLRPNFYRKRIEATYKYLLDRGIKDPLCYELHTPFVINKQKWLELDLSPEYNKRSVYGNIYNIGGTETKDVKVRTKDWIPQGLFASSHDGVFDNQRFGDYIRDKFKNKGYYEK